MAKVEAVSGALCTVENLDRTVVFYEALGFDFKKRTNDYAIGYVNWFWIEFIPKDKVEKSTFEKHAGLEVAEKGAGILLHMSVDDIDEFYKEIIGVGVTPESEPRDFPWGRREFILTDPDGYKIVFFAKKK